jgi:hypothetical protein
MKKAAARSARGVFRTVTLVLLGTMMAGTGCGEPIYPSTEWTRTCPGKQFCFSHPPDLREVPTQPIDSLAGQYRNETLRLTYDLGWYATTFNDLTNAAVETTKIDGRVADILTTRDVMALRVSQVHGKVRFAMLLEFNKGVSTEVGRRIFESIEFMPASP